MHATCQRPMLLLVGYWLVIGWLLVGYWLVIGWLLVVGCWLLELNN